MPLFLHLIAAPVEVAATAVEVAAVIAMTTDPMTGDLSGIQTSTMMLGQLMQQNVDTHGIFFLQVI